MRISVVLRGARIVPDDAVSEDTALAPAQFCAVGAFRVLAPCECLPAHCKMSCNLPASLGRLVPSENLRALGEAWGPVRGSGQRKWKMPCRDALRYPGRFIMRHTQGPHGSSIQITY